MQVRKIEVQRAYTTEKITVCAYARVSSDSRSQEDSLENQIETYQRIIKSNPNYIYAGVYADQGISGYSENRLQFQEMLQEARKGNIKLIITKSISRFARNTVTVLQVIREMKELGVGIFFEEQNINTLSEEGEVMVSVLSSYAQEESRSMSENNKWAVRKKFERGEIIINTTRFYGYDKNEYGELVINPKQGLVVAFVFDMYLCGVGTGRIKQLLDYLGVKPLSGGAWDAGTLSGILSNEKHKGDVHLQKTYTPESKRNQTVPNKGEVKSYYITENHPPIVSPEKWEQVQEIVEAKSKKRNMGANGTAIYKNRYPLSGMLICPYCGAVLKRRQWATKILWVCGTYLHKGKRTCNGIRVPDSIVSKEKITEPTVVEEEIRDGEKHYRYTCKNGYCSRDSRQPERAEIESGSVLPGVNRPRRTAIKL